MNWIRQYKLYELGVPMDSTYKEIFEFVDAKFKDLTIYKVKKFKYKLFFMSIGGIHLMDFEDEFTGESVGYLWASYFWELKSSFNLKYEDTKIIIAYKFEKTFNMKLLDVVGGNKPITRDLEIMYTKRKKRKKCANLYDE